jgi:hypothetical protein
MDRRSGMVSAALIAGGLALALAVAGPLAGATVVAGEGRVASQALPCQLGGSRCSGIGFTKAWLNGKTVFLEYSHTFFCAQPPESGAVTQCEAGARDTVDPPSGPVVSPIWTLVPLGFTPPSSMLHCPRAGRCIDHPNTIDLARVGGSSEELFPVHSNLIEEDESFQSTWWPVVWVGVKNLRAWNAIVAAKSRAALLACERAGNCTRERPTNVYLFFQVLGPGMSTAGPA